MKVWFLIHLLLLAFFFFSFSFHQTAVITTIFKRTKTWLGSASEGVLGKQVYNATSNRSPFIQNGLHISLKQGMQTTDGKAYGVSLPDITKQNF